MFGVFLNSIVFGCCDQQSVEYGKLVIIWLGLGKII